MSDPIIESVERWEKRLTAIHGLISKGVFIFAMLIAEAILIIGLLWAIFEFKSKAQIPTTTSPSGFVSTTKPCSGL